MDGQDGKLDGQQIGLRLGQVRHFRDLSRRALGVLAGVDEGTIKKLELGKTAEPTSDTIARLADALGVPYRALAYGVGLTDGNGFVTHGGAERTSATIAPPAPSGHDPSDQPGMQLFLPKDLLLPVAILGRANAGAGGGHIAEGETGSVLPWQLGGHSNERVGLVKIVGHCLYPVISDGDWVLVDMEAGPQAGKIVLVRITATEELVCKIWHPQPDGSVLLEPHPQGHGGSASVWDEHEMVFLGVVFRILDARNVPTVALADPRLRLVSEEGPRVLSGALATG